MTTKRRLSVTVDADLAEAAEAAVASGRADSASAWVNNAMRRQVDHERRLSALGAFVTAYEAEHGEITDDEIRHARRAAKSRAVVVRGRLTPRRRAGSGVQTK